MGQEYKKDTRWNAQKLSLSGIDRILYGRGAQNFREWISANGFPRMDSREMGRLREIQRQSGIKKFKIVYLSNCFFLITIMNLAIALHTAGRVSSTPDEFHTIAKGGIHCSRRQIVGQRGCLPATVIGQSHVFVRCNCNYCKLLLSP